MRHVLASVCAQTHSLPLPWCTLSHGAGPTGTVLRLFLRLGHRSQAWGTLTRGWRGRGKEKRVFLPLPPRAAFTVVAATSLWLQLSADTPAADPAPWPPVSSPLVFVLQSSSGSVFPLWRRPELFHCPLANWLICHLCNQFTALPSLFFKYLE